MSVNGVGNNNYVYTNPYAANTTNGTNDTAGAENAAAQEQTAASTTAQNQTDGLEKSEDKQGNAGLYKPNYKQISRMWAEVNTQNNIVREMLLKLADGVRNDIGMGANLGRAAEGGDPFDFSSFVEALASGKSDGGIVAIDDETRAWAQEMVSDEGFYGAPKTSQRLLDFASALTGGDPDKMDEMRNAIQKSFDEVAQLFGGWDKLPEVTQRTYDMTMQGFEEMKAGAQE